MSIVGGSFIIVIVVALLIFVCSVWMKSSRKRALAKNSKQETYYNPASRPLYARVHKPESAEKRQREMTSSPLNDAIVQEEEVQSITHVPLENPTPREIPAFNANIPHNLRPLPPPPLISGLHSAWSAPQGLNSFVKSTDSIDGGRISGSYSLKELPNTRFNTQPKATRWNSNDSNEPYYDHVETVHKEDPALTSSLQPMLASYSAQSNSSESYYQRPTVRSSTLPRKKTDVDYDYTYKEKLEPSMLQMSFSFDGGQALPYAPIYDSPRSLRKSEKPLEISRQNVVEIRELGMGHFGKVVLGATTGLSLKDLNLGSNDDKQCSLLVAIKKLREDADTSLKESFQKELKFMSKLKHANVVRLLGVCSADESFLIMEYMENGDLQSFLTEQSLVPDTVSALGDKQVTPLILLYIAVQIASGMRYLAAKKFIHRDLATRNCLVGKDFVIKISDFGMSCNLYETSYFRVQGRLVLPIRWMAYESFYGKFSVKSDVWSFGITLWEVYTFANDEPYYEMNDEDFISDTMKGAQRTLLTKPEICPNEVYEVMLRCWVHEPTMRADFEEIYSRLFLTYTKLSKQTG